jgi:CheY-like chemotaxis protein
MDIQMPGMDGIEAARIILRNADSSRRPRIIAVSGHALPTDQEACRAAGMGLIRRPVKCEFEWVVILSSTSVSVVGDPPRPGFPRRSDSGEAQRFQFIKGLQHGERVPGELDDAIDELMSAVQDLTGDVDKAFEELLEAHALNLLLQLRFID